MHYEGQLKAQDLLQPSKESADWALFSWLCDDLDLHVPVFN